MWIVQEQKNLLSFLKDQFPNASKKSIKRSIDRGLCKKNGRIERFSSIDLKAGDRIEIASFWDAKEENKENKILYEDDRYLILDKAAGVVCEEESFPHTFLVHRLDRSTSGCYLLAKDLKAKKAVSTLFAKREIKKTYLALVAGSIEQNQGKLFNHLAPKEFWEGQKRLRSSKGKVNAITYFKVLKKTEDFTLLSLELITGITHQIRVHLSEMGYPILGDYQYGCKIFAKRLFLHAFQMEFIHPFTQKGIFALAKPPKEFFHFPCVSLH